MICNKIDTTGQNCNKNDSYAIKQILLIIFEVKLIQMNSKLEVKRMLIESGHGDLFTEENYRIATVLTKQVEKNDSMLKQFFKNVDGMKEKYKHDLIVKNKKKN